MPPALRPRLPHTKVRLVHLDGTLQFNWHLPQANQVVAQALLEGSRAHPAQAGQASCIAGRQVQGK